MNATDTIPVVILAGGEGSRLGGVDKCLLPVGSETILGHILQYLSDHQGNIYLNANGDLTRFDAYPIQKFADTTPSPIGPIGGLYSALHNLNATSEHVSHCLTLGGDYPFLPRNLLGKLAQKANSGGYEVVYASAKGRDHFVVALWSTLITQALSDYIASGQRSMHGFISTLKSAAVDFDEGEHTLFNINTQAQLKQAETMILQHENNLN